METVTNMNTVTCRRSFQTNISPPPTPPVYVLAGTACPCLNSPGLLSVSLSEVMPTMKLEARVMYTFGSPSTPNSAGMDVNDQIMFSSHVTEKVHTAAFADLFQKSPKITIQNTGVSQANSQFIAFTMGGR